ncbi:hypothetical protein ILUMI_12483, partial [Ignelater luminosus]
NSNVAVDTVTSSAYLNDLNSTASLSVALHEDSAFTSKPLNGFEQNIADEKFLKSRRKADDRHHFLHKDLFKTNLGLYFADHDSGKSLFASGQGFSNWKHAYKRLHIHKTSLGHKNCALKMKKRGQAEARIDFKLLEQLEDEKKMLTQSRDNACASLNKDWNQIIAALEAIKSNSAYQKAFVRNEATGLLAQLNSLETAILSEFWGSILKQFNIVSKILQGVDTDLEVVSRLYDSLITFVENKRDSFNAFEEASEKNPHKNTEAVIRGLLRGRNETMSIAREKCYH